jgi:sugar phosphate isomerase/epimerase
MTISWLTDTVTSDLDRALHYTLLWGFEAVELRTVGTAADRVPHVNELRLRRRLEENEVPVSAIVPGLFEASVSDRHTWMNELAVLPETLAFCKRIGCATVVVSCFAAGDDAFKDRLCEIFRRAGDAAAREGITLAVLNERGSSMETGAALAGLLSDVGHEAVRAAWDPVAAWQAGEDPAEGARQLAQDVQVLRLYGAAKQGSGSASVELADSEIDNEAQLRILGDAGFRGAVTCLVEAEPRAKTGLRDCTYLHRLVARVGRN